MNYRDMLLQDYFDESYDDYGMFFNEGKYQAAIDKAEGKKRDLAEIKAILNKGDRITDMSEIKRVKALGKRQGITIEILPNGMIKDREATYDATTAEMGKAALAVDQAVAALKKNERKQKGNPNSEAEKINKRAKTTNADLLATPAGKEAYKQAIAAYNKKHGTSYNVSGVGVPPTQIQKELKDIALTSPEVQNVKKKRREGYSNSDEGLLRDLRNAKKSGATDAAVGVAPNPSKISRAKAWAGDHKRQLAIGGAAAASAAGAGVTASGVKNIADLKNIAKAKAAWKASGSNLPFEQWRKQQLTKAGIKTGIGGALTALGAGGAVYAAKTKKLNEAEDLMMQYELVELEEAYLEGYYGQLIAEGCGFDSEAEMIYYNESLYDDYDDYYYDDYDDYDYYDEDYMLPYFG